MNWRGRKVIQNQKVIKKKIILIFFLKFFEIFVATNFSKSFLNKNKKLFWFFERFLIGSDFQSSTVCYFK